VERARQGRLRLIGDGRNRVDVTYVEDAARAHLLAADALALPRSPAAGRPYFLSQGEPVELRELLAMLLRAAGLPGELRSVPVAVGHAAGHLLEALYRALPLPGEPPLTRFVAEELSTDHHFSIAAARRDLGYEPSLDVASLARLAGASLARDPHAA
ncbi:MAG: 3-beta hydroxysteroid dehydrogenase, partial [Myxococcales bacterium]